MTPLRKCKHLDHDPEHYPGCELKNVDHTGYEWIQYWRRVDPDGNLQDVQFCKKRGRIYGILACYDNIDNCRFYDPEDV